MLCNGSRAVTSNTGNVSLSDDHGAHWRLYRVADHRMYEAKRQRGTGRTAARTG